MHRGRHAPGDAGLNSGHRPVERVRWTSGVLADAVECSYRGRVREFVRDAESEPIQLFGDACRENSRNGDWYGEHAGKWLITACASYRRTQDEGLRGSIEEVVKFLIDQQEPDGYLGAYAASAPCRLTNPKVNETRSWDLWIHAWTMLGLLAVAETLQCQKASTAAENIGHLLISRFDDNPAEILSIGNHQGLSSAVVIEPLAKLSLASGDSSFADLAVRLVDAMEAQGLPFLSGPARGLDVSELGTGKSYQICWVLNGLVALSRATGKVEYTDAAKGWWENIQSHHLTPLGGPWGGIAAHKEVFNAKGFFSPEGLTETCSTASWMDLCRELYFESGDPNYIEAFELSLRNALLGAMDANGADWSYFTFPNGRRNSTYYWACCKSSGAMALERSAELALTQTELGPSINILEPFAGQAVVNGVTVGVSLSTTEEGFELRFDLDESAEFELTILVPSWSSNCEISVNGAKSTHRETRKWSKDDRVAIKVEAAPHVIIHTATLDHHGQEIVRSDYAAISLGPYMYACGLIDGYKKQETFRMPKLFPDSCLSVSEDKAEDGLPAILYNQPAREPVIFRPYFQAGGRHHTAWRTTWLEVAWQ